MLTETMILDFAKTLQPEMTECFRWLHRHPETAHNEQGTNRFIREKLQSWGIPFEAPEDNITIAMVDSGLPGATVGIRCDTDALPVQEETGLEYASEVPGVMHACGHDAHITAGLFAARMLQEHQGQWHGRAKVIFQPAEEGEAGSLDVLATGLVDDVDVFFGIHVWSPYASGTLHASANPVSAAVDMFTLRIQGKGGHGATPDRCADAVVAASALVMELQTAVSRRVSPMEPALLTIGSFHAGTVGNVIANEAELKGTIRSFNPETRHTLVTLLDEMTRRVAEMHGCTGLAHNRSLSDAVINDPRATAIARRVGERMGKTVETETPLMLGDDFADYGRIAPYCYAQVGIADEDKGTHYAHHNGRFKVDEEVLPLCAAWMAAFAADAGENWQK